MITSRLYEAKDRMHAENDAAENLGIVRRRYHPTLGLCYEVIYVPPLEPASYETKAEFLRQYCSEPYRSEDNAPR